MYAHLLTRFHSRIVLLLPWKRRMHPGHRLHMHKSLLAVRSISQW